MVTYNGATATYKGYTAMFEVDLEDDIIHGKALCLRDMITFEGQTIAEAKQAFKDAVDEYLAYCSRRGKEPGKSSSEPGSKRRSSKLAVRPSR